MITFQGFQLPELQVGYLASFGHFNFLLTFEFIYAFTTEQTLHSINDWVSFPQSTIRSSTGEMAMTFPKFRLLPVEIQQRVWSFAARNTLKAHFFTYFGYYNPHQLEQVGERVIRSIEPPSSPETPLLAVPKDVYLTTTPFRTTHSIPEDKRSIPGDMDGSARP